MQHSADCPASVGPILCCCGAAIHNEMTMQWFGPDLLSPILRAQNPSTPEGRDQRLARVFATEEGMQVLAQLKAGALTPEDIDRAIIRARARWAGRAA